MMAIIKKNELKQMSVEDLNKKLEPLKLELMKLRSQSASGSTQNPGRIRLIKRTIAKVLTKLKEKQKEKPKGVKKK